MRRAVHLAMVAFWAGVPLLAVGLAVSWPWQHDLGRPIEALWAVVVASSAFLTSRAFAPTPDEDGRGEARWASESSAYPIVLFLALSLFALQIFP